MTYQNDCTLPNEILEQISDYLPELIRVVVNAAMKAERQQYLGVAPYERSEQRRDQANGFKLKTARTSAENAEKSLFFCKVGEKCIGQIDVEHKSFTTETQRFALVFLRDFVSPWFKKCAAYS